MQIQNTMSRVLAATLSLGLAFSPQLFAQQAQTSAPAQQPQQGAQPAPDATQPSTAPEQTQQTPATGTTVNPSQGPLQPVTTYPD
ncbi:MAG TPA: hypothetical protein VLT16_05310, partial [Candidatus Limnocylindrales bacterium]|nr:hypothetical protein [Candidatus Limnocylindrales bacterium]